jgi:hypothetical protein
MFAVILKKDIVSEYPRSFSVNPIKTKLYACFMLAFCQLTRNIPDPAGARLMLICSLIFSLRIMDDLSFN